MTWKVDYDAIAVVGGYYEEDWLEMDTILYKVVKRRYIQKYDNTVLKLQDYLGYLDARDGGF